MTALPCDRAIFCKLKEIIFAVSRSRHAANSSISHHCLPLSISLAILYRYFWPSLSWLYVRRKRKASFKPTLLSSSKPFFNSGANQSRLRVYLDPLQPQTNQLLPLLDLPGWHEAKQICHFHNPL